MPAPKQWQNPFSGSNVYSNINEEAFFVRCQVKSGTITPRLWRKPGAGVVPIREIGPRPVTLEWTSGFWGSWHFLGKNWTKKCERPTLHGRMSMPSRQANSTWFAGPDHRAGFCIGFRAVFEKSYRVETKELPLMGFCPQRPS